MLIETTRFGELELKEETVIRFPWGLPGFEQLKRYVLLEHRQGPFQWLQAVDDAGVAFVVCQPDLLGVKYQVPEAMQKTIELRCPEDLGMMVMVSFDRARTETRFHLTGPLLFNATSRLACQWTIDHKDLSRYVQYTQKESTGSGIS